MQIASLAAPIMLANIAAPLLGLVDTAVIGQSGNSADLGAIALGSLVFSFIFWGFGFLRMGTTGFTAQAAGAGDWAEVRAALGRALFAGLLIGLVLLALQYPVRQGALWLLQGSDAVELQVEAYFQWRIWGAPAALGMYALLGTLIGLGHTRQLLWLQLILNGANLVLDVFFVVVMGWGVQGIALGTVMAEWLSFTVGLWWVLRLLPGAPAWDGLWRRITAMHALRRTLHVNSNIMWRTFLLLAGFGWFANQGALFGDDILAANHILLQFIALSAFILDGYAHAVESLVGRIVGARQAIALDRVIRVGAEVSGLTALVLALCILFLGPHIVPWITELEVVNSVVLTYLPYASLYVLVSFAAFHLDGIFIGATGSREMRNSVLAALLIFILAATLLISVAANHGLWLAFILFVVARAILLARYLPRVRRLVTLAGGASAGQA